MAQQSGLRCRSSLAQRSLIEAALRLMEGLKRPHEQLVRPLSSASPSTRFNGSSFCAHLEVHY